MLQTIWDGLITISDVKPFTWSVIALLCLSAIVLVKMTTGSSLLTALFLAPTVLGALIANYAFEVFYIFPIDDKDANVVVASACGVLGALIVMTLLTKLVNSYLDYRWRHTHPGNYQSQS